ncbi:MAG: tryptophan--tRNA ligase [Clostridiales bacterium]|nr:tryptophan--tRNA ligase [Clostridiales bacterium]
MGIRKSILSGIQPSGIPTLGNYTVVKNWVGFQENFECLFMIADLHSITVQQEAIKIRENSLNLLALLIACGIDPNRASIFFQSHVSDHCSLSWILSCVTSIGELFRMTQFKEKSENKINVNAGLFTYPVLMAADILLYKTNFVPVGKDQKQHLELTRDLANRFNRRYGNTFIVPEPYIFESSGKIMSLQNPSKKMSKSDKNENSFISLLDSKDKISKKIKKSVTDSENCVCHGTNKDGIENLMNIYSSLTKKSLKEVEEEFYGKEYGVFKRLLTDVIVAEFEPIQKKFNEILDDKIYLEKVYKEGAYNAKQISKKTLDEVCEKIGFVGRCD